MTIIFIEGGVLKLRFHDDLVQNLGCRVSVEILYVLCLARVIEVRNHIAKVNQFPQIGAGSFAVVCKGQPEEVGQEEKGEEDGPGHGHCEVDSRQLQADSCPNWK